jgi:oxygen-independent coproporphyrinogen-3 oxidase
MVTRELRATGRSHDSETVAAAFANLKEAGIENITADLIAGLPHQTEESWEETLRLLSQLRPAHLSVYMLEVDADSRLGKEILVGGKRYGAGTVPSEEQVVQFYSIALQRLRDSGFERYEISNFAQPGRASRHNDKYWTGAPYFGFGLDAHSYDGQRRWSNTDNLSDYLNALERAKAPIREWKLLGDRERLEERFFLGLRRLQGISLESLEKEFGVPVRRRYEQKIRGLHEAGWLVEEGDRLRLTDEGVLFSNDVFAELLAEGFAAGAMEEEAARA